MSYNEQNLKEDLIKYGKLIWEKGYSPGIPEIFLPELIMKKNSL